MSETTSGVINIDDEQIIAAVGAASSRLIIVAAGLSRAVAEAVAAKWRYLGPAAVKVVLDVDPEVCRLGYGELAAIELLQQAAQDVGASLHHQQGIRICVVITDEATIVYAPTPLVVEAKSHKPTQPNGVRLDFTPPKLVESVTAPRADSTEPAIAPVKVEAEDVKVLAKDLAENPPVKFDISRKVHVFNAAFEFVEFKLEGCSIARKTVRLPSDLVVAAKDQQTRNRVNSNFHLIDKENSRLSGERVMNLKEFISRKFLVNLTNYGNVVLRTNKADFESAVKTLVRYVERFQKRVKKELQSAIDDSRKSLVEALLPAVISNPPARSIKHIGRSPDAAAVQNWLDAELAGIFGTAEQHMSKMEVSVLFKGVTYESLKDPGFIETTQKQLPTLKKLHDEFDTAKTISEQTKHPSMLREDFVDDLSKAVN
jgi:hypothetical protein